MMDSKIDLFISRLDEIDARIAALEREALRWKSASITAEQPIGPTGVTKFSASPGVGKIDIRDRFSASPGVGKIDIRDRLGVPPKANVVVVMPDGEARSVLPGEMMRVVEGMHFIVERGFFEPHRER